MDAEPITPEFEELVCDYVFESTGAFYDVLDYLLDNQIPDALALKAMQRRNINFGTPELLRHKARRTAKATA